MIFIFHYAIYKNCDLAWSDMKLYK